MKRSLLLYILSGFLCTVNSEEFPDKPIKIIVNSVAGGSLDINTRLLAKNMHEILKVPVIVENKGGGDGVIGINAVKNSDNDGYTLLATADTFITNQFLGESSRYKSDDFIGLGRILKAPLILLAASNVDSKDLKSFLNDVRKKPGFYPYASAGNGTTTHIGMEKLNMMAGVSMQHIPYKGSGAAYNDVAGGRIPIILSGYSGSVPYISSGKMQAFGVTSENRIPSLPDVPTVAEQGVGDFYHYVWFGLLAPNGTPNDRLNILSNALKKSLEDEVISEKFKFEGAESTFISIKDFNDFLKIEEIKTKDLILKLRIK